MPEFDEIRLPPVNAIPPAQALRALANSIERGDTRSVYVVVVKKDGRPAHALHVSPVHAARDMDAMTQKMVDAAENFYKAQKLGIDTI